MLCCTHSRVSSDSSLATRLTSTAVVFDLEKVETLQFTIDPASVRGTRYMLAIWLNALQISSHREGEVSR